MVVHLFLALTVSIKWRLLFPTLCWSINYGTDSAFYIYIYKKGVEVCTYIHKYHSSFIPEEVAEECQIFLRDAHVAQKLLSYE
jgi:hypothetical protein